MSDLEKKIKEAEVRQKKGEAVEAAQEAGLLGNEQPTEYAKSAKLVVDKMFDPIDEDDKQLLSSIPNNILPNTMMLVGGENAIRTLYRGDVEQYDPVSKTIVLYRWSIGQDGTKQLVKYRTVTEKGYTQGHAWADYWHGFIGGLFMQLPAVDGKSREQGVAVVSAITNSDRALLEAQNNAQAGFFRRAYNKVFK